MRDGLSTGALAYEAYGNAVDWKNYTGKPMPKWADLPDKIRAAWQTAADAVKRGEL